MPKSYGLEYFVIIAAMAASLSVPVFASSLVSMTGDADSMSAAPPSTVRTLGTIPANEVQNPQPMPTGAVMEQDDSDQSMRPVEINGIKYVTGGIGDEERAALDSMKRDFNLHIVSAGKGGEYVGGERIVISDRKGTELLNVPAGPIFYVQLPAGSYAVEARTEGQKQGRNVAVGANKSLFVHFTWH